MSDNSGFQIQDGAPSFYETQVALFMAPFVERLVSAAVQKGDKVLDVATGTGFAARAASAFAGPGGNVVGSDVNSEMVAMAETVPHDGDNEIIWRQASALELPFDDADFDAVICQQGIQFFPDIPTGLREMARVTRNGGRFAATVWAPRNRSPYLDALFGMLIEHCDGKESGAYAEGGKNQVREWFEAADLGPINIELVEAVVSMPPVSDYVHDHLKALPTPSVGSYFNLDQEAQDELLEALDQGLSDYRTSIGFDIPFRSYLITTVR
jgi:ubiquinone/menaquinone biosynthesis C-methylase UbiE